MSEVITEKDKEYEAREEANAPRRGSGDERPCEQPFAASQFQRLH